MLKNKKKWLVLMAIVSSISMISTSFASDTLSLNIMFDPYYNEEKQRIDEYSHIINDTLGNGPCIECGQGRLRSRCYREKDFNGSTVHGSDGCIKSVYYSGAVLECNSCYAVALKYENHWCWETHTVCWRGNLSRCPMDEKDEDESGLRLIRFKTN